MFEKFVVIRITIGGQANIPSFQAERVVRSRSDFKSLQPIEEFVRASLDSGKMLDIEGRDFSMGMVLDS